MAGAASLDVNPIGFELPAERPAAVLQITNTGAEAVRIQVTGFDWRIEAGQETLTDNNSLLLNPPIFWIAPGKTQFLRFGLRRAASADAEQAFRLLIDEVPTGSAPQGALRTLLRISLPVFIAPQKSMENISWQLAKGVGAHGYILIAQNHGNLHKKILRLTFAIPGVPQPVHIRTPIYLLPGQTTQWPVVIDTVKPGKTRLGILSDKAESEEDLTLDLP